MKHAQKRIQELMKDKRRYESDRSNAFIQEKELGIIAEQIISLSKSINPCEMTAEEKEAVRWAKNFLLYR